jgi:hypothetical protein
MNALLESVNKHKNNTKKDAGFHESLLGFKISHHFNAEFCEHLQIMHKTCLQFHIQVLDKK